MLHSPGHTHTHKQVQDASHLLNAKLADMNTKLNDKLDRVNERLDAILLKLQPIQQDED